jgi:hypothetical protein
LRGGGHSGAAIADEWISFGSQRDWQAPLLKYAIGYAAKIEAVWKQYSKAYDKSGKSWAV